MTTKPLKGVINNVKGFIRVVMCSENIPTDNFICSCDKQTERITCFMRQCLATIAVFWGELMPGEIFKSLISIIFVCFTANVPAELKKNMSFHKESKVSWSFEIIRLYKHNVTYKTQNFSQVQKELLLKLRWKTASQNVKYLQMCRAVCTV